MRFWIGMYLVTAMFIVTMIQLARLAVFENGDLRREVERLRAERANIAAALSRCEGQ